MPRSRRPWTSLRSLWTRSRTTVSAGCHQAYAGRRRARRGVIEQPRGEAYYYVRGNGTKNLDRFRVRTPTSQNLAGLTHALQGVLIANVPMIILTIDPCISCTER